MINCTKRRNVSKLYTNMHKKTYLYKNLTCTKKNLSQNCTISMYKKNIPVQKLNLCKKISLKTVQKVCTKKTVQDTYLYKKLTCAKNVSKLYTKICVKKLVQIACTKT